MKKSFITIIIVLLILSLAACSNANDNKTVSNQNNIAPEHNIISYEEFQNLFTTIGEKLNIDGYAIKGSTIDSNIVIIDKESSFGKRSFLTLDGSENGDETQERIIYENTSEKCVALVDLIYLKSSVEKDLVFSHTFNPYDLENSDLISKIDSLILSYNNILIKITLISDTKVNYNHTNQFTNDIVNILSEFDKSIVVEE